MSKKKVLYDRTAPKVKVSSFNFAAPSKERATTGYFMSPGDYYGVGVNQPVGTVGNASSMNKGPIPQESVCFPSSEAIQ